MISATLWSYGMMCCWIIFFCILLYFKASCNSIATTNTRNSFIKRKTLTQFHILSMFSSQLIHVIYCLICFHSIIMQGQYYCCCSIIPWEEILMVVPFNAGISVRCLWSWKLRSWAMIPRAVILPKGHNMLSFSNVSNKNKQTVSHRWWEWDKEVVQTTSILDGWTLFYWGLRLKPRSLHIHFNLSDSLIRHEEDIISDLKKFTV
jgi:hypothetical protein